MLGKSAHLRLDVLDVGSFLADSGFAIAAEVFLVRDERVFKNPLDSGVFEIAVFGVRVAALPEFENLRSVLFARFFNVSHCRRGSGGAYGPNIRRAQARDRRE